MPSLLDFNSAPSESVQPTGLGTPSVSSNPWEDAVGFTLKHEGGLNPRDTNGTPSMRGINQAAHPEIDVTKLDESGARQIYRKDYWDAIGGDALAQQDPKLAKIAFDTAVLSGPGRAKEFMTLSGGDPDKFMSLRESFLQRLIQKDPAKYGKYEKAWANRNAELRNGISGGQVQSSGGMDDWDSFVAKHGVNPFPLAEPSKFASEIPDLSEGGGETSLGRALGGAVQQTLSAPQPQIGKLPGGFENKGSRLEQTVKDAAYGVLEGSGTLVAGIPAFIGGQLAGSAELSKPRSLTENLASAFDVAEKVAETGMGHPQTATGQLLLKPIEVTFGTMLNSVANVVKEINPNDSPEELETKVKAAQYVANTLLLGLPLAAKKFNSTVKISPEKVAESATPEAVLAAKESVKADPNVAPEVKAQVDAVDINPIEAINQKVAQAQAKARVEKTGGMASKVPENQPIVDGLLVEVELREGRAKTTMRKAASIVAEMEGDVALVDLKDIKGINPEGSTGKAIARLVAEREAAKKVADMEAAGVGEDVPLEPTVETPPEVSTSEPAPVGGGGVDLIQEMAQSIDPSLKYDGVKAGIPEAGIPDQHNFTYTRSTGEQPSFIVMGEITPEKIAERKRVIEEGFTKAEVKEEVPVSEPIIEETSNGKVQGQAEEVVIPEFDNTKLARGEGYKFPTKKTFTSLEEAQAKADTIEDAEVIKVGKHYRVAKFEETPVKEFTSEAEVTASGLELMSEIPKDKVRFESPSVKEGFGIAKVGDKYYRTSTKVEMPDRQPTLVADISEDIGDGVSVADRKALLAFTDEATLRELEAQDRVKELSSLVKTEKKEGKTVDPAREAELREAYEKWKDSYVTKSYVAIPKAAKVKGKKPTKESMATIDDNFKTFESREAAEEWMAANNKSGHITEPDPLTGRVSYMKEDIFKSLEDVDPYAEGVEQLMSRRGGIEEDFGTSPDYELSDTGRADLWSIMADENGPIRMHAGPTLDLTALREVIKIAQEAKGWMKKTGENIDAYIKWAGLDLSEKQVLMDAIAALPKNIQQLREQDSVTTSILMPEGELAVGRRPIKKRNGEIIAREVPISKALAEDLFKASDKALFGDTISRVDSETGKISSQFKTNSIERAMNSLTRPLYVMKAAGLKGVYNWFREAASNAAKDTEAGKMWLKDLKDQIPKDRLENFAISLYERMKGADEALRVAGIEKAKPLTEVEQRIKQQLFEYFERILDQINYIRVNTGLKAIPKLKDLDGNPNYLPLIRSMVALRDLGINDGLTTLPLSTIASINKNFHGIWSSYSLERKVSNIPIELDPFRATEKYMETAYREIHLTPVAALAKKMATAKMKRPGEKVAASMLERNPGMGEFLINWSDQILGKDPAAAAMLAKNNWVGKQLTGRNNIAAKIVASTIGFGVRTILVQPSAYLTSTLSNFVNPYYAFHGISKLFTERPDANGMTRYQRESNLAALRKTPIDLMDVTEYLHKGFRDGLRTKTTDISLKPMAMLDQLVAEATWNAAVKFAEKKLKLESKDAINFADEFTEKAQGLAHSGAKTPFESTATTRWMATLQSFGIAEFNFIARNILGIKNPSVRNKQTVGRVVRYLGAMALTGQLYKMIGLENVVPDPIGAYEEAKQEGASNPRALLAASSEFLEKVPLLGSAVKYGSSVIGPVPDYLQLVTYDAAKNLANLTDWDRLSQKERVKTVTTITKAVGYGLGVPGTNQVIKSVNAAYKGGNPWEIIIGAYKEDKKVGRVGTIPSIPTPNIPTPGL